jgi:hypothetical protein
MIIERPYPLFPLPADYESLSAEGQKAARLSVLCNQSTPANFVLAWDFFRNLYLSQTKEAVFYRKGFSESPEFHYDLVHDIAKYARNVEACPRGSAKSTILIEVALLLSLTRPFFEIMMGLATDRLVEERFDKLMMQIEHNELIIQDFGVMKPKRGQALWNHHYLTLLNGSFIKGLSVMGKKRGGRPNLFMLDDVENDPDSDSETSRAAIIEKFEMILFRQIIPMLEAGSSIVWVGTLIDRKSFLYRATTGDDSRFDFWNRKVLKAIAYDEENPTKTYLLWPSKWPKDVLEARKEEIGVSAFHSEYLNEPVSAQDRILTIDPRKNEYSVEGEFDWKNPLSYNGKIKWQEREITPAGRVYHEMEKPYRELVRPMFRALLFDYASGLSAYNDYSCIGIVGFDTQMTMWLLHLWLGRAKDATLMRLIYETGLAWRPRVFGIEAVSIQKAFAEALREYVDEQGEASGQPWRPRIFPVTYPSRESKAQRISSSLAWRFDSGRIKYPAHLAGEWPYSELYAQTADFTMDLALLQHDDAIDTLAMSKYVVKTRGSQRQRERGKPGLLERIIRNQPQVPGLPLLSGVSTSELTDEMVNILSHRAHQRVREPRTRRLERRKSNIIR